MTLYIAFTKCGITFVIFHCIILYLQVTYQMKIIATALFMVVLLGRSLSRVQWMAIFILAGGVALVQVDSAAGKSEEAHYNYPVGLAAISVSCLCSGFAGKINFFITHITLQNSHTWFFKMLS